MSDEELETVSRDLGWLRFDTGYGLRGPYTTDCDGYFRCRVCDTLLGARKARYCDMHKSRRNRNPLKVIA